VNATTLSGADRRYRPGPVSQTDQRKPTPRDAVDAVLRPRLLGPAFVPGDPGYDADRQGYSLAVDHRPAVLVGASGPADVMAAVEFATKRSLPVGVLSTGHGPSVVADGAMLINTSRMQGVHINPYARIARIEAGVRWQRVIHEAAAFGLAPLSGSSPAVGAVGYTLGGGLGLLGRAFGYAADHVRSIDVVTAHGALRQVTPEQYADLFWALRGGKGNFGVVTSMEIGLFPVARIYGGGLYFRGSAAPAVLNAYRRWVKGVPEEMTSSVGLIRFPLQQDVPAQLRGRFVVQVRIAYHGSAASGEELVRPLREVTLALADTVTDMPYTAAGSIHNDPIDAVALYERTAYLRNLDEEAADAFAHIAGPDSNCPLRLVELRHLGGALGREPEVPNAVGNRDARFLLYVAGVPTPGLDVEGYADAIMDRMVPWSTGGVCLNFLGANDASPERVRATYSEADYRRLVAVKRTYDPENLFRVNHNIPPIDVNAAG
jgi:FAD/FMN-containing dehydrogenase